MEYRIYVASLLDYDHGVLHGRWIDLKEMGFDPDCVMAEVGEILEASPYSAEEWFIHDQEGFHGLDLDEWDSFETYCFHAQMLHDHGEAWRVYAGWKGKDAPVRGFENNYRGAYKDAEDAAHELLKEQGYFDNVPDTVKDYFDYESFARDMFMTDMFGEEGEDGYFYVFWNH